MNAKKNPAQKDIYSVYVDVFRRFREDALAARACRMWMLTNVATRCECSVSAVRNAVSMDEHKRIVRRYS